MTDPPAVRGFYLIYHGVPPMVGRMADDIFEHPRLVTIYDALDPDRGDLDVYVAIADELGARCVEYAHQCWAAAGRPGWSRLGLAVTPDQQVIYVDEPGSILAVLASEHTPDATGGELR